MIDKYSLNTFFIDFLFKITYMYLRYQYQFVLEVIVISIRFYFEYIK